MARMESMERRRLLTCEEIIEDLSVTVSDVTGGLVGEIEEGTVTGSEILDEAAPFFSLATIGYECDPFNGFDRFDTQSNIQSELDELENQIRDLGDIDVNIEITTMSSSRIGFLFEVPSENISIETESTIRGLRRVDFTVVTNEPVEGSIVGFISYNGLLPGDEVPPADGAAGKVGTTLLVNGTGGDDIITVRTLTNSKIRTNINGTVTDFDPAGIDLISISGGSEADLIEIGTGIGRTRIDGKHGTDTLMGGAGADEIIGGDGPDFVAGNDGDDLLVGGNDSDSLSGGLGKDRLFGGPGDDRVDGNGSRDLVFGEDGNDRVYGGSSNDLLDGGGNVDRLFGGDGNDDLFGGGSNDKLYGDAGNDVLSGGKNDDRLEGGSGDDMLLGDSGAELFIGNAGDDGIFSRDGILEEIDAGSGFDRAQIDEGEVAGVEELL